MPLGEPHRADFDGEDARDVSGAARVRRHIDGELRAAAADVEHGDRALAVATARGRAEERVGRLFFAPEHARRDPDARGHLLPNASPSLARRSALVAIASIRSAPAPACGRDVLVDHRQRAGTRAGVDRAGFGDARTEPRSARLGGETIFLVLHEQTRRIRSDRDEGRDHRAGGFERRFRLTRTPDSP